MKDTKQVRDRERAKIDRGRENDRLIGTKSGTAK